MSLALDEDLDYTIATIVQCELLRPPCLLTWLTMDAVHAYIVQSASAQRVIRQASQICDFGMPLLSDTQAELKSLARIITEPALRMAHRQVKV